MKYPYNYENDCHEDADDDLPKTKNKWNQAATIRQQHQQRVCAVLQSRVFGVNVSDMPAVHGIDDTTAVH